MPPVVTAHYHLWTPGKLNPCVKGMQTLLYPNSRCRATSFEGSLHPLPPLPLIPVTAQSSRQTGLP